MFYLIRHDHVHGVDQYKENPLINFNFKVYLLHAIEKSCNPKYKVENTKLFCNILSRDMQRAPRKR